MLGSLRHDNIVELLTSYSCDGITSLLFPLADSDLHDFLLRPNRPIGFEEDFTVLKAAHGLSSGLLHLHNFPSRPDNNDKVSELPMIGYHHDIKPENVLVRNSTFVLADFGLSRLKMESEGSQTKWKDTTYDYGAPECRNLETFSAGTVGRALDMWSLGCVLSEVGTYLKDGSDGVQSFRNRRVIEHPHGKIRCFHDGTSLSQGVTKWFDYLEIEATSAIYRDFVTLLRRALQGQPGQRPNAETFDEETGFIAIKALLEALSQQIKHCVDCARPSDNQNVFQTRIQLEKNRLIAWAGALGLVPVQGQQCLRNSQVRTFSPYLYTTLQGAFEDLKNPKRFDSTKDNQDFVLNTLCSLNNDLGKHLSSETKASIDDSFVILSTSNTTELTLPAIERATLKEHASCFQDIGDVAAMKYCYWPMMR